MLNFFETDSLKYTSNVTCSKIVNLNSCENCQSTLQVHSELNVHTIIGEKGNVPNLTYPSANFIKIFERVFELASQIIPSFASVKSIKTTLIEEAKKRYDDEVETKKIVELNTIGCVEHNQQVVKNLFESTIDYALKVFCKNINGLLTGKIDALPPEPNAIQDLARTFWVKKKRIGKHSDIFST